MDMFPSDPSSQGWTYMRCLIACFLLHTHTHMPPISHYLYFHIHLQYIVSRNLFFG
ncbi:uncharacterized protein DS421_13g410450 [Arachis hypogaea]|nr:uncharacterized protein DS421_13g410450 [Arachis hypogaea]